MAPYVCENLLNFAMLYSLKKEHSKIVLIIFQSLYSNNIFSSFLFVDSLCIAQTDMCLLAVRAQYGHLEVNAPACGFLHH